MITRSPIPDPASVALPGAGGRTARRWLALSAALLVCSTAHALAQAPDPEADHVWGGCVLTSAAVTALEDSIQAGEEGIGAPQVSFVVVYTLANPNDGQDLGEGGPFTGPVICINASEAEITAFEQGEGPRLTETSVIPDDTGPAGADSVDLLAAEEAFILQYEINDDDEESTVDGNIEKRICHTVAGNSDCFIISPLPSD